jgi:hypothetical protein
VTLEDIAFLEEIYGKLVQAAPRAVTEAAAASA